MTHTSRELKIQQEPEPLKRLSGYKTARKGGQQMARKKENMNLATEIICDIKRRLIICRIALAVSLAGNVIMAAMLICK